MDLDIILITYNREKAIARTLERLRGECRDYSRIIVVDNASTDGSRAVAEGFKAVIPNLEVVASDRNLGVAGGRNLGIRVSSGEVLVFLDDDAEFSSPGSAGRIKECFAKDPGLGAAAFKILNGHTGAVRPNEVPHRDKRKLRSSGEREVAYFVGAGHAIRRSALGKAGSYPEEFFYSQEELYLSYKLIKAGYRIVYLSDVEVLHWQAASGRVVNNTKWVLLLRNTLLVNYAFLPWSLFLLSILVWTAKVAFRGGGVSAAYSGLDGFRRLRGTGTVVRDAISYRDAVMIWRIGGRVLW